MKLNNCASLKKDLSTYIKATATVAATFGGPSIYFHEKALEYLKKDFLGERHIEYIYATLASWGMHRMGQSGAKMPDFNNFQNSILKNKEKLISWKNLRIEELTKEELEQLLPELERVCFSLNGSETDSKVVSATKILAHILPDLVCPMDRNYTLDFFNMSLGTDEKERRFFRTVMIQMWEFFQENSFKFTSISTPFSESYPKIFDNLIIAYMKANPNK